MSTKQTICVNLDPSLVERIDALAATMQATRTWTVSRLLDAALDPAGCLPSGAGSAGSPSPGIGPVATGEDEQHADRSLEYVR